MLKHFCHSLTAVLDQRFEKHGKVSVILVVRGWTLDFSKDSLYRNSSCVHLWQALMYVSHWDLSCRGQLTCATQSPFSVCKSQNLIQKFLMKILSPSKMFLEFTLHSLVLCWLSSSKFLLNVELATNGNVLKKVF